MTAVPVAAPQRLAEDEAEQVRQAIDRVLQDGPWILGDPVATFEAAWAAYTGHPEVVLDAPDLADHPGAERLWRVTPRKVIRRPGAWPLRFAPPTARSR